MFNWKTKVTVYEMGHELFFVLKIDSVCLPSCLRRSPPPSQRASQPARECVGTVARCICGVSYSVSAGHSNPSRIAIPAPPSMYASLGLASGHVPGENHYSKVQRQRPMTLMMRFTSLLYRMVTLQRRWGRVILIALKPSRGRHIATKW